MKKFCVTAVLFIASAAWAQAPVPTVSIPNIDVYGGFLVTSPDYGPHWDSYLLHGFEAAVSKGITDRLWITGSFDFVWANPSLPVVPGGVPIHIKQVSATVGPKYYILMRKIRPYVTGQIGYARQSSKGFYAGDHHPPLPAGTSLVESGFTYRFGAGAELEVNSHVYVRLGQWDIQPQPWGRHKPFYQNVGAGIGYRF